MERSKAQIKVSIFSEIFSFTASASYNKEISLKKGNFHILINRDPNKLRGIPFPHISKTSKLK